MNTKGALRAATRHVSGLSGHVFDLLNIAKPISPAAAVNLTRVISKLSPLLGNLIEFNIVEFLNDQPEFKRVGKWRRQDPGFPDTIFEAVTPPAGLEIKAWFPLATEITARFKDSQKHFASDQTHVCILAWLPEFLIHGRPRILAVCVVSGLSVATARDSHYHKPPEYLVLEPEDTASRTRNLQQTNTNGYKWQGTPEQMKGARKLVANWGPGNVAYNTGTEYQKLVRKLLGRYPYRLDTNFAKMDRIVHREIEAFKERVFRTVVSGMEIAEWRRVLYRADDETLKSSLEKHLGITEANADELLR